jgi:hypothetical protein
MSNNQSLCLYPKVRSDFRRFLKSFQDGAGVFPDPIKIKVAHTYRVVREIRTLSLSPEGLHVSADIAQTAAILHDIGRFQQYAAFNSYDDRTTTDHAALSIVLIDQLGLLDEAGKEKKHQIRTAVRLHNSESIEEGLDKATCALVKMLRDADKLDIWRVIISMDEDKPIADDFTKETFDYVRDFRHVPYAQAKTKADMRLFRVSWLFDLFYPEAIRTVLKRGYVKKMFEKLPQNSNFYELKASVEAYLHREAEKIV